MKLKIDYSQLQLINYQAAGNKTPVLDISTINSLTENTPEANRAFLESDLLFRKFIAKYGKNITADTVMVFYRADHNNYDYVTYVVEPNSDLRSPFSNMCGNGIRALALHLGLATGTLKFRIYAGDVKTIQIVNLDQKNEQATVQVNLGKFHCFDQYLLKYVTTQNYQYISEGYQLKLNIFPDQDFNTKLQIGLNGDHDGEPHLVLILTMEDFQNFLTMLGLPDQIEEKNIIHYLRKAVCTAGMLLTNNRQLFPYTINFNLGVIHNGKIYMSTHERNLVDSAADCQQQQVVNTFCKCNTLACGTGGAVVANYAVLRGLTADSNVTTVQPGGEVLYKVGEETIMIGPAQKVAKADMIDYNTDMSQQANAKQVLGKYLV